MRSILILFLAASWFAAACSSGQPSTFTVTSASVDPTYWCPGGANNARYDLHATIDVHNGTSKSVEIESATARMKLISVKGDWLEKVGESYDATGVTFSPAAVGAGASAPLKVTIPSACTSAMYGSSKGSNGEYEVIMHIVTSAGSFSITAQNHHEILAAA